MAASLHDRSHREWPEFATAAVVVALGATWIWLARDYGLIGEGGRLDAGTLPALAGGVLVVCGSVTAWSALRQAPAAARPDGEHPSEPADRADGTDQSDQANDAKASSRARTVFLVLFASLALATAVGFSLSLALFTFLVLLVLERRSVAVSACAAVAMWAFGYICFEMLLGVPLPGFINV